METIVLECVVPSISNVEIIQDRCRISMRDSSEWFYMKFAVLWNWDFMENLMVKRYISNNEDE